MGCINSKKHTKEVELDAIPEKDADRPLPPQPGSPLPATPTLSQKCKHCAAVNSDSGKEMFVFVLAVVILKALYDYEPRQNEDLGFKKNDRLELVNDRYV